MKLKDALEIVLGLAEDNTLLVGEDGGSIIEHAAVIEAQEAQQEALKTVRAHWRDLKGRGYDPHR